MEISPVGLPFVLIVLFILLIFSFILSFSEYAFFSISDEEIKNMKGGAGISRRLISLKQKPMKVLSALLITGTFINVSIILLSAYIIQALIPTDIVALQILWMQAYGWNPYAVVHFVEILLTVIIVVLFVVFFGEILPQVIVRSGRFKIWKLTSVILSVVTWIFGGISNILLKFSSSAQSWFNDRLYRYNINTSGKGEIGKAIDLAVENAGEEKSEVEILKRIVKFGDVTVKQIMCSRIDMVALDSAFTYDQVLEIIRESGYSRFPVYDEDLDHVLGILYVKDIIGYINMDYEFKWQNLVREDVLFVPESKKIKELLREFQSSRMHMAIVVDEFGGTEGLVTLEDVMEEVIGDIRDEFDEDDEVKYKKLDNHNFIFEGKTLINDFCRITGIDTSEFEEARGESDSIAGLVLEIMGEFPEKNSEIHYNGYIFTILKVGKRRIEELKITIPTPTEKR